MPTPRLVQIAAWSYSRWQDYELCPFKAKCKHVTKLKEPDSPSGVKGTRVHALAALIATGKLPARDKDNAAFYPELEAQVKSKSMPAELETFKEEFRLLKKNKCLVEQEWAFTRDWEPTGWFSANCWLRVKVDNHYLETRKNGIRRATTVHVIDYKTGREYEDHKLQRSLYALGAFLHYPDAERVVAAHWYLDGGTLGGPESWERAQLPALQKEWLRRTTAMLNDTTYAPRPNDKCRYCHFRRSNGGPCKF